MSANSLYDSIASYLRLSARVVSKVGNIINVGEKFTLRFTGSNVAYSAHRITEPSIIFNKARVYVRAGRYAKPVGGSAWHNLPDAVLYPGESSFVDIKFEATGDIPGIMDWFREEHVATARIYADLDQNKFFNIRNELRVHHEIVET